MDARLHGERIDADGRKITYRERLGKLPDGVMVRWGGQPALLFGGQLLPWSFEGYGVVVSAAATSEVDVLTPPSTVAVIRAGYVPMMHASAGL
jgi:hypothetical protein